MLSDEEFVNCVWNKYEDYINSENKDEFFERRIYRKNSYIIRKLSAVASFMLVIFTTFGVCLGVNAIYNYIQKNNNTDFSQNIGYDYSHDMKASNGVYYKKIENYNEYKEAGEKWSNLVEMSESDFNTEFLIIIAGENYDTTSLEVKQIYTLDSALHIDLIQTKEYNKDNTVLSLKVSKDLNRDNVVINIIKGNSTLNSELKDINELAEDYTSKEAIEDGCLVIENNQIISADKNALEKFIENSEQNTNSEIRLAIYSDKKVIIKDLSYKDGKYYMEEKDITDKESKIYQRSAEKIKKQQMQNLYTNYYLEDAIGNQSIICLIAQK